MNKNTTPVMKQFWNTKKLYPDSILLFRMGDFYETFDEDAKITSNILGITLTKRANGAAASVPLAGFPYHSLQQHLYKLLESGHKVAICEQVEDPKLSKGIVKREVVEVLSPGAAITDNFIDSRDNNFLCSLTIENDDIGYSILDYSTGTFFTGETKLSSILDILNKYKVREVIIGENQKHILNIDDSFIITTYPNWMSNYNSCYEKLTEHFNTKSLKGFGIEKNKLSIISSGSSIFYLESNFFGRIKHITSLCKVVENDIMKIDSFTIRNLEIFNSIYDQSSKGSLISIIDNTITPMGSRLLKNHLIKPLTNINKINNRLNCVESLVENPQIHDDIRERLKNVSDIERIIGKISTNKSHPNDLINLSFSLNTLTEIKNNKGKKLRGIKKIFSSIKSTNNITKKINKTIRDISFVDQKKGGFINTGISKELDELRSIEENANAWLVDYQENQKNNTGISSLKIGFNKIFGYYIDVTKTHIDKVPENFIRKQTLTNSERYFTVELKEYEDKILIAEEKIKEIEFKILNELLEFIIKNISNIQHNAEIIAKLDVYVSHAAIAKNNKYNRPKINNKTSRIYLKNSRHPVIEDLLPLGERFIPNDITLDCKKKQIAIITGPNMAGKSTFLRQVGILSILSQIGSFVPADKADICIIDQLFTRVGASDNLSSGESTFLVEMNETANILNNATKNSLIILDEIGRGTSTFDGLSIAWSIIEYIHNNKKIKAKTLFASHYHELINLAEQLPNAFNLNVAVEEFEDEIIFLRKIKKGGASRSYGINVAKMAGLPNSVLIRANELLAEFMKDEINTSNTVKQNHMNSKQIEIFDNKSEIIKELKKLNIDELTPIEAINKLNQIKEKL